MIEAQSRTQSEAAATFSTRQTATIPAETTFIGGAPPESYYERPALPTQDISRDPEPITVFIAKTAHRPSSRKVEALYPSASRQDIRTTEETIRKRRRDITRKIMEKKDLPGMREFGFVSTVVFERRNQELDKEIRDLGGEQKLDRDRLRPSKISFRNGPEEKRKRQIRLRIEKAKQEVPRPIVHVRAKGESRGIRKSGKSIRKRQERAALGKELFEVQQSAATLNSQRAAGGITDEEFYARRRELRKRYTDSHRELRERKGQPLPKEKKKKKKPFHRKEKKNN